MKILIVEDDLISRRLLQKFLLPYGDCETAVDGLKAITAIEHAFINDQPYDLICLDIMMPQMDGHEVLKKIRDIETQKNIDGNNRVKIIMTTALTDRGNVVQAAKEKCDAYIAKPINKQELQRKLQSLGLLK